MLSTMEQTTQRYKRKRRSVTVEDILLESCAEVLNVYPEHLQLDSSFLFHGGNSISALALSAKLKQQTLRVPTELILTSQSLIELISAATTANPKSRARKRTKKPKYGDSRPNHVLCRFERVLGSSSPSSSTRSSPACESLQMTEMQQTMLHGSCQSPGTNLIQFAETFDSRHVPALKKAWEDAMSTEPIFQQQPTMNESGEATLITQVQSFDWTDIVCTSDEFDAEIRFIPEDRMISTKFRAVSIKTDHPTDQQSTTIIWNVNHALIDGYSAMMLYDKVRRAAEGASIHPGTPFTDVSGAIEAYRAQRSTFHKQFWTQKKLDYPLAKGALSVATSSLTDRGARQSSVSLQHTSDLQSWCSKNSVTLASLHYSVWALILSAYADADSVVFGTVLSGRNLDIPGVEDTIGPLVNTLPFYVTVDESKTSESFVRDIFTQLLEWNEVQTSVVSDGFSRNFGSSIAMEIDKPSFGNFGIQGMQPSFFDLHTEIPLSVTFNTAGRVSFRFATSHFSTTDVEMISRLYNEWLTALTTSSSIPIGDCLSDISKRVYGDNLLRSGNLHLQSTYLGSVHDDLVTLFEKAATMYPNQAALELGESKMTYAELDRRANHAAACLSELVGPRDVVCVHADRSLNWIIAIYAILKLGAIYAPLDPNLPGATKTANYRVADAALYITPSSEPKGPLPEGARIVSLATMLNTPWKHFPARVESDPDAAAYVCFTSGSTGKPKAVLCHHRGVVAFQLDETVRLFALPETKVAQIMSPAFDGSIHELFSALSYGATLVLPELNGGMRHLGKADSAILTPSVANVMDPDDYPRLKHVYFVGEPVSQSVCDKWASSKRLFNMYGPTESTCGATIKELHTKEPVTIGRPNPTSRVYILDRHRRVCPPNVTGDMFTAGVQVSSGYLGDSAQTSTRFLPDTFRPGSGEMMYWTGDRGCWTYENEIRCLGRSDRQIKLNGFRLDLNLLEEQIRAEIPEVDAVGLVKKGDFLQAAVTPCSVDASQVKAEIAGRLPAYALPRYIFPVSELPKTTIGKTDYHSIERLSPMLRRQKSSAVFTEAEAKIYGVLEEVFRTEDLSTLSPHSAILDLGGNSLDLVTCANRLAVVFSRPVTLKQVIEAQTVRSLALAIRQLPQRRSLTRSPSPPGEDVSFVQADWFKKYELYPQDTSANVSVAWKIDPDQINRAALAAAWDTVLSNHQILRSLYKRDPTHGIQRAYHVTPPKTQLVDGTTLEEVLNTPFQLETDHLIRVYIASDWMAVVISHIICDLTTVRNLLTSVASLYTTNTLPSREEVPSRHYREDERDQTDNLAYWQQTLCAAPRLQMWTPIPERQSLRGTSRACWLPQQLLGNLGALNAKYHTTLHQLALAAMSLALQHEEDVTDLVLGAPYRNRQGTQMNELGLFLEPLPIRVQHHDTTQGSSAASFLDSVRRASQNALSHAIPWSRLLQLLDVTDQPPHNPLFDVMLTFHDYRGDALLSLPGTKPLQTWSEGAKFKLMAELSAYSDTQLMLRLEYDDECFTKSQIDQVASLMGHALQRLTEEMEITQLREELCGMRDVIEFPYQRIHVGSEVDAS